MFNFWKFFVTHNRFSFLAMVALTIFGAYAIITIPKESAPEVQVPVGIVSTVLPGASSLDVESLITNKIEQNLSGTLENVKRITSSSREGVSSITVEFDADADIDESIQKLKDQVDTVVPDLPDEANDPIVSEVDFVDQPILTVAVAGDLSERDFYNLKEELEAILERLPGVSRVEASGVRDREVAVIVDETALAQFDITINDIVRGIQQANATLPVGAIESNGIIYNIAFEGDIADTESISDIPVAQRGGQPLYIRDIATVIDGFAEASTLSRLSVSGAPAQKAISLNVFKTRGGDITRITDSVNQRLVELQNRGELLEGLTVESILDSGNEIKKDLLRLSSSGLQTVFLVVVLLVVAIGWREGLLAGAAIPLSFTIGFIGLLLSGNTINFISLFALILAVGILVDSAIVIVEGINKRMKTDQHIDKREAALQTVREFSVPLMAGTFTTIAMFSGLFLISGVSGQFISGIPFTINFVLLASLLVALGFLPLLASLLLRRRNRTRIEVLQSAYSDRLEHWYSRTLSAFLQNKKKKVFFIVLICVGFVVALALPVVGLVKVIFFDQEDIDWIYVELEMPQSTDLATTDLTSRRVEEILYENTDIDSFVTTVGASSAFASNSGGSQSSKFANFFITLRSEREKTSSVVVNDLRKSLNIVGEGIVTAGQPNNGPPTGSPIAIKFFGQDLDEISNAVIAGAEHLKTIPGTTNVQTGSSDDATEFVLTLNREQAARYGLTPFEISQTLRTAVFGTDASSITTPGEDIDIVVKLALNDLFIDAGETNEVTIDRIKNLLIRTQSGESIPVASVADTSIRVASAVISHEDGDRVMTLTSDVTPAGNVRDITNSFLETVRTEADIPDSVILEVGGENEESQQAFKEMFLSLLVGIILMLVILVLQFNSFRHTIYVLSILPFSLIGIMVGLALTGKALSFPSLMGFVALSGIVVNNSILLIDQMNANRRKQKNVSLLNNIVDAATSRLRPILLTACTTVIGIFPLTFASDLWSPLAYAIMFGLAFSVIITLLLIPIIYLKWPGTLHE